MIRGFNGKATALSLMVMAAAPSQPASAQDVEWSTWSKVELAGFMGTMARMFGGNMESTEKTYIKGGKMRADADKTSSIVDLENGRFMSVDHSARTYTVVTMADVAAFVKSMEANNPGAAAQPPREEREADQPEGEVDVQLDLKVDRTGEKQKVLGYDAERVFITFASEFTVTPEGEEAQQAGTIVIFMDSWHANGVPAEQAQMRMAEHLGPEVRSQSTKTAAGVMSVFSSDPKARAAVEKAAAEAEKMAGFEMKGTMHVVLVPPGMPFDRDKVLADEKGGGAGQAARRGIGGMIRGAIAGDRRDPSEESKDPSQSTIARVRTEVREMKTASIADSMFEPPAGYREIVFNPGG